MSIHNLHKTKLQFKLNQGEKLSNAESELPEIENVQQTSNQEKTRSELISIRKLKGVAKTLAAGALVFGTFGGVNSATTAINRFDTYDSTNKGELDRQIDDLLVKKSLIEGSMIATGIGLLSLSKKQENDKE